MTDDHGIEIRLLGPGDESVLDSVAESVFDHPVDPVLAREYLAQTHCHLAVALDAGVVVGMASAMDYVHPDKPRELWINEVGVAATHRKRGIAARLLEALFAHGRRLGCRQAWVLTHRSNAAAMRLYASAGGLESATETTMLEFDLGRGCHDDGRPRFPASPHGAPLSNRRIRRTTLAYRDTVEFASPMSRIPPAFSGT